MIADDKDLEQRQAKLLVCQSLIAHARHTLPPDEFWKRTRHWMEEWDRLDDEIREYLSSLPPGAEERSAPEGEEAFRSAFPSITARNTVQILGGESVRLEFRTGTSGDLIQTYELRGARAWAMLQSLAGAPPPETPIPSPALDVLKDRLDAAEFALVEARNLVDNLLLGEALEEIPEDGA